MGLSRNTERNSNLIRKEQQLMKKKITNREQFTPLNLWTRVGRGI